MKFDVYKSDGEFLVYKRGEIDECGCLPDGEPLFKSSDEGECFVWCESRSDWRDKDRIRVCDLVGTYKAAFVKDLKRLAQKTLDDYRAEGEKAGWGELQIDLSGMVHTFRHSADWKNEPIKYTFAQRLMWSKPVSFSDRTVHVREKIVRLVGMAEAAYELGLSIAFDADFKIHIYGVREMWQTSFE